MAAAPTTIAAAISVYPMLMEADRPKANGIRTGDGCGRVATQAERAAGRANLFYASTVAELRALGFVHILPAPVEPTVVGEHDVLVADEAGTPVRTLWLHPALDRSQRKARTRTCRAARMISEVSMHDTPFLNHRVPDSHGHSSL
jgi:hypothetical protein